MSASESSGYGKPDNHPMGSYFSIIVVTHNGETTIGDCLEALKDFDRAQEEIILVDNDSSDRTIQVAKRAIPTVRVVSLHTNKGYGAGCNVGAQIARGRLLLFLNQDVRVSCDFLDKLRNRIVSDPTIGICGGTILSWDGSRIISAGQSFEKWTSYSLDNGFGSNRVKVRHTSEEVFSANGAAFAARREMFDRVGRFNEDLFMYFDETDLAWRMHIAGYKVVCCSDAIAFHKIDPERAHNPRAHYYIDRNSLLSAAWNYELASLLVLLPTALAFRAATMIVLVVVRRKEHARSTARALYHFFTLLPQVSSHRRFLAPIRRQRDKDLMKSEFLAKPKDLLKVFLTSFMPHTDGSTPDIDKK